MKEEFEETWVTEMGAWFSGERVVCRGKDLFSEFGGERWMHLLLYGLTGREFTEKQILMFEQLWVLCSSYPEPRLWNNRVAALTGTAKATASLGVAAGIAVTEAKIYGVPPLVTAMRFLKRVQEQVDRGGDLNQIVVSELREKRVLAGFGRPIVRKDERIEPLMYQAKQLGFSEGGYLKLAFEIEEQLQKSRFRISMNIALLVAALAADFGLNEQELESWATLGFSAGIVFCFADASKKPEGAFFPFRCERISYQGAESRKWEN